MMTSRKAPSLVKLCIGSVIANLRYVGNVGGIDLHLLQEILPHCTIDQLMHIEESTEEVDLSPVTNDLWKRFYEQQFGEDNTKLVIRRMKEKQVVFKWRNLYKAKTKEREAFKHKSAERLKQRYEEANARVDDVKIVETWSRGRPEAEIPDPVPQQPPPLRSSGFTSFGLDGNPHPVFNMGGMSPDGNRRRRRACGSLATTGAGGGSFRQAHWWAGPRSAQARTTFGRLPEQAARQFQPSVVPDPWKEESEALELSFNIQGMHPTKPDTCMFKACPIDARVQPVAVPHGFLPLFFPLSRRSSKLATKTSPALLPSRPPSPANNVHALFLAPDVAAKTTEHPPHDGRPSRQPSQLPHFDPGQSLAP
ncbi:hypothetical protein KSP40_PGU017514 [Platanthera guangdongensis]|uniref:Elongin-A n=1 Tax=Platanthera guangdongensis TaxID=2320717 RepID=A0ABR2N4A7_9ASPA